MSLYDAIYDEVSKTLCEADAELLALNLSTMSYAEVKRLFDVLDNYEPSETEQGLIPIPEGYAEQ